MIKVRAKQLCFVGGARRRPGQVFDIESEKNFSEKYLERVEEPKKASKPAAGKKGGNDDELG